MILGEAPPADVNIYNRIERKSGMSIIIIKHTKWILSPTYLPY